MATLYEIDNALMECFDPETGEIDEARYEQLQMEREQKIEGVACWFKNLKSDISALKEEEKNLAARRKVLENKLDSLKNWLAYACEGSKFSTSKVAISWRKSVAVDVFDSTLITDEFVTYTPSINKTAIKDAIKEGRQVEGARLAENTNIQIK